MKYENRCPTCGRVRVMRRKTEAICMTCARTRTWQGPRLAALHTLIHRTRLVVAGLQVLVGESAERHPYDVAIAALETDVAALANEVMVAQLALREKGVAA